jgi:cobalamin biosynthetic protein CobC
MDLPHPHGGSLAEARARFPDAPEPRLDLSTGINPTAYPAPQARADRLPEPTDLQALETAAARAYALPHGAQAVAGPGTGLLMTLMALFSKAATVAIVGPTYAGHARAWSAAGARIHDVPSLEAARSTGAAAIVVTRPNNPDGRITEAALLEPDPTRLLIVDEAFADLEPCATDLPPRATRPGLILLRSFGKTYGLPGVRLAFALGADPILPRVRAALGPWPVSAHALSAGLAALPDAAWRTAQRQVLTASTTRLDTILSSHGHRIEGGTNLFRLTSHPNATTLWHHLGRAGILVRRFPEAPHRLRFGIPPTDDAHARLAETLEKSPHHQ